MTAMQALNAEAELTRAIVEAIAKAAKAGLDEGEIKAVLEHCAEQVDQHGIDED